MEIGGYQEALDVHVSDRKVYDEIYNFSLGQNVVLTRNDLESNRIEFGATIESEIAYYYFSGILPEQEFNKVVEKFYFTQY